MHKYDPLDLVLTVDNKPYKCEAEIVSDLHDELVYGNTLKVPLALLNAYPKFHEMDDPELESDWSDISELILYGIENFAIDQNLEDLNVPFTYQVEGRKTLKDFDEPNPEIIYTLGTMDELSKSFEDRSKQNVVYSYDKNLIGALKEQFPHLVERSYPIGHYDYDEDERSGILNDITNTYFGGLVKGTAITTINKQGLPDNFPHGEVVESVIKDLKLSGALADSVRTLAISAPKDLAASIDARFADHPINNDANVKQYVERKLVSNAVVVKKDRVIDNLPLIDVANGPVEVQNISLMLDDQQRSGLLYNQDSGSIAIVLDTSKPDMLEIISGSDLTVIQPKIDLAISKIDVPKNDLTPEPVPQPNSPKLS